MAEALTIYGIPQSRAARCLWMARELGVPHEVVPVHYRVARDAPELLRVNPNGRIPAMEDSGFALFESIPHSPDEAPICGALALSSA